MAPSPVAIEKKHTQTPNRPKVKVLLADNTPKRRVQGDSLIDMGTDDIIKKYRAEYIPSPGVK